MAIDKNIYNNGINGQLSFWEIDSLPYDYEGYKSMFKDATARRMEKDGYNPPKVMSRLEEQKRIMQVLSRASYGMNREKEYEKCEEYGVMTKWQKIKMKIKFIFNIKRWWNLLMLRRDLMKNWKLTREKYRDSEKELKAFDKEMKDKGMRYNMDSGNWIPIGSC